MKSWGEGKRRVLYSMHIKNRKRSKISSDFSVINCFYLFPTYLDAPSPRIITNSGSRNSSPRKYGNPCP